MFLKTLVGMGISLYRKSLPYYTIGKARLLA
jgi:hypothetical protein